MHKLYYLPQKSLWKSLWERTKCWLPTYSPLPKMFFTISRINFIILATNNLSSANTFNKDQSKNLLFDKYLTLSQTSPGFYVSTEQAFKNTVDKGEFAHNEQFLLFPHCFPPDLRTFCHLYQI